MELHRVKTAFYVALRYLFSKKKHNIINVVAIISTLGIMASAAALIIVLSVFNGMETLIAGSFNTFNPDFTITATEGKSFAVDSFPVQEIQSIQGVASVQEVVSDMTLVTYEEKQMLVRLKGVAPSYPTARKWEKLAIDDTFDLTYQQNDYAAIGAIAAGMLQINLNSLERLTFYYPKRTKKNLANPADAFNKRALPVSGVFSTNTAYDEQYVFCSIDFARELMRYEGEVTSMEVLLDGSKDYHAVQQSLEKLLGDRFIVKNQYQQEALLFKTMKSEKLIIFFILAFILIVAIFNIIGTLGMLIVEKKTDISVLQSLGADHSLIRQVFIWEGLLISMLGGLIGMVIGFVVCWAQQTFHLITFGSADANYVVSYYPVAMSWTDFLVVFLSVIVISLITSLISTRAIKYEKYAL